MSGIKLNTIEEHYFNILIPGKVILDYVFNNLVVLIFVSCINGPRNNSCISCGHQQARSFKNGWTEAKPIDVIPIVTFGNNAYVR
jgi:hypothetical protein